MTGLSTNIAKGTSKTNTIDLSSYEPNPKITAIKPFDVVQKKESTSGKYIQVKH